MVCFLLKGVTPEYREDDGSNTFLTSEFCINADRYLFYAMVQFSEPIKDVITFEISDMLLYSISSKILEHSI